MGLFLVYEACSTMSIAAGVSWGGIEHVMEPFSGTLNVVAVVLPRQKSNV
jgi:hypothetical protein